MSNLLQQFKKTRREELAEYKFKSFPSGNFIRVVNDIIQSFSMQRFMNGYTCTAHFQMSSLCYPSSEATLKRGLLGKDLNNFKERHRDRFDIDEYVWTYDRNSDSSIANNGLTEAVQGIK